MLRAERITAMAPATRSHRKYRLPCLVMLQSLSLPPVVCCFGTSPIQATKRRPDLNAFQSPISATRAVAITAYAGKNALNDHRLVADCQSLLVQRSKKSR